jgi:hypothetical protein
MNTMTVRTNKEISAMNLSYYTLCRLSDAIMVSNPLTALEHFLSRNPSVKGELTLDSLGNFVSFQ